MRIFCGMILDDCGDKSSVYDGAMADIFEDFLFLPNKSIFDSNEKLINNHTSCLFGGL